MKKVTKVIAKGLNGNLPSTVAEYNVVVKEHDFYLGHSCFLVVINM